MEASEREESWERKWQLQLCKAPPSITNLLCLPGPVRWACSAPQGLLFTSLRCCLQGLSEVDLVMKQTHFSVRCITSAWGAAKTRLTCSNPCLSLIEGKFIRISKHEAQVPVYLKTTQMTLTCSGFETRAQAQDKNARCPRALTQTNWTQTLKLSRWFIWSQNWDLLLWIK